MFDQAMYDIIFRTMWTILNNNAHTLGKEFCDGLMFDHDVTKSQQSQANAQQLFHFVSQRAQQISPQDMSLSDDQMFRVVGQYVDEMIGRYRNARQAQTGNQGFGGFGGGMGGGFTSGGGSRPLGSMLSGQNRNTMSFSQPRDRGPGSHLHDDTVDNPPMAASQRQDPPQQIKPAFSVHPQTQEKPAMKDIVPNPLDDFPESGADFQALSHGDCWGGENPSDRTIVVTDSEALMTRDGKYVVSRADAHHRLILSDPYEVVRDFFKVASESILSRSFVFRVFYNHLEVINVPTAEFIRLRHELSSNDSFVSDIPFHKRLIQVMDSMQRGVWEHMSTYLVKHINRALHLSCRRLADPSNYVKITALSDLETLLSPEFRHPLKEVDNGRDKIKAIITSAIWNAIAMNTGVMFEDPEHVPTRMIQVSPAFPYALRHVYPNKWAIPHFGDPAYEAFFQRMTEAELNTKTYLISKRSVVITNTLGQKVLPGITDKPQTFGNPVAAVLNKYLLPFVDSHSGAKSPDYVPQVTDGQDDASETLTAFYNGKDNYDQDEPVLTSDGSSTTFPVDQTVVAIQYGVSPSKFMMALDVFSVMDAQPNTRSAILGRGKLPVMHPTA